MIDSLRYYIIFYILLCSISVFFSACNSKPAEQILYLENGKIRLGFGSRTGTLFVLSDMVNDHEYLNAARQPVSLWEIEQLNNTEKRIIDSNSPADFHVTKPSAENLLLIWENFQNIGNEDFKITIRVQLEGDSALSSWKITLAGIKGMNISKVVFPVIPGLHDPGEEYLAVPLWMGELIKNPRRHLSSKSGPEKKYDWYYPGTLSMQCLALYDSLNHGFYAACNDSLAYRKTFSVVLDSLKNLNFLVNNYPSLDPDMNTYSPPYEMMIGAFRGDWITAAARYREWGARQSWSRRSRLRNRLSTAWLEKTALWIWNRSKSENVLVPAAELKQRLNLPVSVFWHWWHGCSYDDGFPEYFPPREGKQSFAKALAAAQKKGLNAIVYMNVLQWGDSTESWKNENASYSAVKNIDGKMNSHVYNVFTGRSLTNMCIATQFWRDKYALLSDQAINEYHLNGIYMDQTCLSRMCYDGNHGHPVGGGNYWVQNFAKLERHIRSNTNPDRQPVLTGEGCGEVWLPNLDAFLALQVSRERYAGVSEAEPIPFFQAVYHQYGITYGNYSSLLIPPYDELWPKKFAPENPEELLDASFNRQFLMEQARSFVWGMQPTLANYRSFLNTERKSEIDYLLKLARIRYRALKYLLYGQFLRSPQMTVPCEEINISRLSIYAGRYGESVTAFQKSYPLIYSGTWKSEDHQIGIALASISDDPYPVNLRFGSSDYGLPDSGRIYLIDDTGRKFLTGYADKKVQINFMLPARGLCLIEIIP